ncbi:SDR family NAD(P)-dependent oxidoreductase [bacterium]|nr:SDR family NAD(P)-dependent oxidoreductase [bacterium]
MIKSVLITGANGGLGKDTARQLALLDETERIYLGCRNEERAKAAKLSLEASTGKSIFEILLIDVSNLDSVRSAVNSLNEPIDALVMNAGGMGGKQFADKTVDGVIQICAINVLGHVVLAEELLKANKLTKVALYVGSEGARGVPAMFMKRPALKTSSVDEFASICDGSFFGEKIDGSAAYPHLKYVAALWMSSLARKYPEVRIVTMSPGSTSGTDAGKTLAPAMKFFFTVIGPKVLPLFGLMHKLELGAKRFVDGLNDESYKSGVFYGSEKSVLTGPLVDQATIFSDLNNVEYQDNANEAIHRFIN